MNLEHKRNSTHNNKDLQMFQRLPDITFQVSIYTLNYPAITLYVYHMFNGEGVIILQCVAQQRTCCWFWYCHHQHTVLTLLASSDDTVIDSKVFFHGCLHAIYKKALF